LRFLIGHEDKKINCPIAFLNDMISDITDFHGKNL